jgi:hypothetical protein
LVRVVPACNWVLALSTFLLLLLLLLLPLLLLLLLLQVTVVLKGMFTLDEAAAGGSNFATELETDVAAECSKLGAVEKVCGTSNSI